MSCDALELGWRLTLTDDEERGKDVCNRTSG